MCFSVIHLTDKQQILSHLSVCPVSYGKGGRRSLWKGGYEEGGVK